MPNINDIISGWRSSVTYPKFGITSGDDGRYYYSLKDNNLNNTPDSNLGTFWDGYVLINSQYVPDFFWQASYTSVAQSSPRIVKVQFGNGYQKRIPDGLNTNLLTFQLNFEARKENEINSIIHFLQQMNGQKSFIYNPPAVYGKTSNYNTRYICPNWEVTYNFYQNYSLRATFEEVSA